MGIEQGNKPPGEEPKVIKLRGFFVDPEGNLRRGVPIIAQDEEGNEITVNREHNTGKVFPVSSSEAPPENDTPPAHE